MNSRNLLVVLLAAAALAGALWMLGARAGRGPAPVGTPAPAPSVCTGARAPAELVAAEQPDAPADAPPPAVEEPRQPVAGERRALAPAPAAPAPGRWLAGTVLRADLSPVQGATLRGQFFGGPRAPVEKLDTALSQDGAFRIALAPAWTAARLALALPDETPLDRYVPLAPGDGVQDLGVLVLSQGGVIAGCVRGLGTSASWSVLVLPHLPELPSSLPRASTGARGLDESGRFRLEHVPPGPAELTLFHPLLGKVLERELEVRAGAITPFDFTYTGPDPARALFVTAGRAPGAGELWLEDRRGRRLQPFSVAGTRAVFADLDAGLYTLTLALAGQAPVVLPGQVRGTRASIGLPPEGPGTPGGEVVQRTRLSAAELGRLRQGDAALLRASTGSSDEPTSIVIEVGPR